MTSPHPHAADQVLTRSRIVVVDDEPRNVLLLERVLALAGYLDVHGILDPRRVLPLCRELTPDLLVLDLHMPGIDGVELIRRIRGEFPAERYLPILVLTADATEGAKRQALAAGAHDFLTKPFSLTEATLRIRNLLETRALYRTLSALNAELATRVDERTRELEATRLEVLERLSQAVEFRDDVTGGHTRRVGERAAALAARLGLDQRRVDLIRRAAPLHDVGKIGIPDSVLRKPGPLTPEEFAVMREHTTIGGRILGGGRTDLMAAAEAIAVSHHERWDGIGYPAGLSGEAIPIEARLVTIADVYDALTSARPYRRASAADQALQEIRAGSGRHFDPSLVPAFEDLIRTELLQAVG